MKSLFIFAAGLLGAASARTCINQTVPVTISARNGVFNLDVPATNMEVPGFVLNLTTQGRNFTNIVTTGYATINGTYNISTTYCTPSNGSNSKLQFLTHGIGFDKSYWDIPYNNYNYSYVNTALAAGYSTFTYDRLGIGNSSKGNPLTEIQSFLEVAAAVQLTRMIRNGSLPGINSTFSKVIHVGHSFGSIQTYALANSYPTLTDGIVLTGFSLNNSFMGQFAAGAALEIANKFNATMYGPMNATNVTNPNAENLANGYLISSTEEAVAYDFALINYVDPGLLRYAFKHGEPVTIGELLTTSSGPMVNNFARPVLVFTGNRDVPFCGGNCTATGNASLASIPAAVQQAFPNVAGANFTAYIQPHTAHGLNIHYNATAGYTYIQNWLSMRGL